jgi:superfamily II DNA or RNA helicase
LSATPYRRDRLTRLIYWYLGDKQAEIDHGALIYEGSVLRAKVITRETKYITQRDPSEEYSTMLSELTCDHARNCLIVDDVIREARDSTGICLVLTDRKAHCETLAGMIRASGIYADVLTGDLSDKERQAIVERLNAGEIKILIATGQLIGEGFDCKELTTLFLATPIKFSGRLIQYLGRVLRPAPGKAQARLYDYIDIHIGVLANAARGRQRVYMRAA